MRFVGSAIVFLAVNVFLLSAEAAQASRLTICNESDGLMRVAILWQNSPYYPFEQSWKVYGWAEFPPGCQGIVQTVTILEVFVSVVEKSRTGKKSIMHFQLATEAERKAFRGGELPAERFFCVKDEPFDRILKTLDEHEKCPPGWYSQLFNLYVRIDADTNFNLTLGK